MVLLKFNWDFDLGSLLGLIGLLLSGLAMWRTRMLEKQQLKLNQYEIEEKEKEREDAKHSKLVVNAVSVDNNDYIGGGYGVKLKITNKGKCDADNVKFTILNEGMEQENLRISMSGKIPSKICSGDEFEFDLHSDRLSDDLFCRIDWTDDSGMCMQNIKVRY